MEMRITIISEYDKRFITENSLKLTQREIATKLGITVSSVQHYIKKNNLEFKRHNQNEIQEFKEDFSLCPILGIKYW
jgi:predicted XRE-type DNA-binding protein